MSARVTRRGEELHKPAARLGARDIRLVLARTERLVEAGLRTPRARYDPARRALIFPWIDGTPGREALRRELAGAEADAARVGDAFLDAALGPVADLHRMGLAALELEGLDPWRRVDPRLAAERAAWARAARGLRAALGDALAEVSARAGVPAVPVHGDFHVGQLVFDPVDGGVWLLDLDDLAAGPVESDVANFAAHVVTSDDLHRREVLSGFVRLVRRLAARYARLAPRPCDPELLRVHGAAALLRRALKLAERGLPAARLRDLFRVCEQLGAAPLPR